MYIQLYTRHWYPLYIRLFFGYNLSKTNGFYFPQAKGVYPFWRNAGSLAPSDQTAQEI